MIFLLQVKGIDVSTWQGSIDWEKVKQSGIGFAILRAGYGGLKSQKDNTFEQNYRGAIKAGIPVGAYHYSYADSAEAAKQEAQVFLSRLSGKVFQYPVCLDLESSSLTRLGRTKLTEIADTFLSEVQSAGWYVCLYSNKNWLRNYLDSRYLLKKYDLWLAHWTKSNMPDSDRSSDCGIWQYTSKGRVEGIRGWVDMDIAYRDYPGIISRAGLNGHTGAKADKGTAKSDRRESKGSASLNDTDKGREEAETARVYIVKKGDTLWDIAKKMLGSGLEYKEIMKLNALTSSLIFPGQKLKLPH